MLEERNVASQVTPAEAKDVVLETAERYLPGLVDKNSLYVDEDMRIVHLKIFDKPKGANRNWVDLTIPFEDAINKWTVRARISTLGILTQETRKMVIDSLAEDLALFFLKTYALKFNSKPVRLLNDHQLHIVAQTRSGETVNMVQDMSAENFASLQEEFVLKVCQMPHPSRRLLHIAREMVRVAYFTPSEEEKRIINYGIRKSHGLER